MGDLIINPFKNGKVDPNYTSSTVEETQAKTATEDAPETISGTIALKWCPVVPGSIEFKVGSDTYFDDGAGKLYKGVRLSRVFTAEAVDKNDGRLEGQAGRFVVEVDDDAVQVGTVTYGYANAKSANPAKGINPIYDANSTAAITLTTPIADVVEPFAIKYIYNNVAIMQNDLPYITVRTKGIYLMAKARRVAINYSQIAAKN